MSLLASALALFVALSAAMAIPAVAAERRVALVISNSSYQNTPVLTNPPLDAKAVAATLKGMQFGEIEILTDANADVLRKRLRDFAIKARLADVALIYYAGHGLEVDGQNYFVPVDARLETEFDVSFEAVSIDLAVRAVNGAKKLKLIILDACRDNPLAMGQSPDGRPKSFGTGLAPIETAGDVLVSYAAAAGQVAQDGAHGQNSPFAKALTEHLRAPGVDVRQVLGRVRDRVMELTGDAQRPFIYASLGGDPIYLVPPPDAPPPPPSPVVVDLTIADPEEEAVRQMLGEQNNQFQFAYDIQKKQSGPATASVRPRLDYFISAEQRGGRPLIESLDIGYFAPEEGIGVWSVSFPLLDVVARRNEPRVVTLSELMVEVEQSARDDTPYIAVASPSDSFARLVLFNEGWTNVRRATLEYDIVGFDEPSREAVEKIVGAKRDGGYRHAASVGPFQDYAFLSLREGLARELPDFRMYDFANRNPPSEWGADGKPKIKTNGSLPGFQQWLRANPQVYDADNRGRGLWIVGRLIVQSTDEKIAPVVADVVAPVPMYPPEGLGGGAIAYNLKDRIALRTDGLRYAVRKNIGYLLDNDTKTFRGLYPMIADRTSRHRLRLALKGDGGQPLWTSEWMDVHVLVPRMSKKAAEWSRAGAKGRLDVKGLP